MNAKHLALITFRRLLAAVASAASATEGGGSVYLQGTHNDFAVGATGCWYERVTHDKGSFPLGFKADNFRPGGGPVERFAAGREACQIGQVWRTAGAIQRPIRA